MSIDTIRILLGVLGGLSVVLCLASHPRLSVPEWIRVAALGGVGVAWLGFTVTVLPESIQERLNTPLAVVGAFVVLIIVVAVLLGAGYLVARFPGIWFIALGLAMPVRIPVPIAGETKNLLLPLYLMIALGVAGWLVNRRRDNTPTPRSPLDIPLGVMIGFSVLSIAWSVDQEEGATKAVFFYLPFVGLYLAALYWWPRARATRNLAAATIALAVPVSLLALWQFRTQELFLNERLVQTNRYSSFFRANAIFFDPNIMGRFLVIAIIAVVAIAWIRRENTRMLVTAGLLLIPLCGGLAVSFSRSSCLMLITGMAFMAWWAFGPRRTILVGVSILVVLGAGALATSGNIRQAATDYERLNKVSEGRFDLMRGGYEIWREAPIQGSGLGGFEERYRATLTPSEQRRIRVVISHNAPITVLSELGLIGIGLLTALGIITGRVVRRRARAVGGIPGWVAWTMLGTLAGILVHTLLYSALFEDPYCWVLLAGMIALTAREAKPAPVPADIN